MRLNRKPTVRLKADTTTQWLRLKADTTTQWFRLKADTTTQWLRLKAATTTLVCTLALLLGVLAAPASAQGYISPLIGFDFGGDSGCPEVTDCEERKLNFGVAVGSLGSVLGSELEIAYANNFFGDLPGVSSSVLTVMGNVLVAPRFGPVQPYGAIGLGLIKTDVELDASSLLEGGNNALGWDIGGGAIIFFSDHVGIRGDIRHFHSFKDIEVLGISIPNTSLNFGRAAAALVLKF